MLLLILKDSIVDAACACGLNSGTQVVFRVKVWQFFVNDSENGVRHSIVVCAAD